MYLLNECVFWHNAEHLKILGVFQQIFAHWFSVSEPGQKGILLSWTAIANASSIEVLIPNWGMDISALILFCQEQAKLYGTNVSVKNW